MAGKNILIWPHYLVFPFRYGHVLTFIVLLLGLLTLFKLVGALESQDLDAAPLFFSFLIAYIIPASHFINRQQLCAFDDLKPVLQMTEAGLHEIRDSLNYVPARTQLIYLLAGSIAGCLQNIILVVTSELSSLNYLDWFFMMVTIFLWCLMSTVISALNSNALRFGELAARTTIDLLAPRQLNPYAQVAVYSTLALIGAQASFPLLFLEDDFNEIAILPGFFAIFIPMIFIFLVPLLPVRRRVKVQKRQSLEQIQARIERITQAKNQFDLDAEQLGQLHALLNLRAEIAKVPEWPFDSPVIVRLLIYLIIPPLTWVGAALIERMVDSLSL